MIKMVNAYLALIPFLSCALAQQAIYQQCGGIGWYVSLKRSRRIITHDVLLPIGQEERPALPV